MKIALANTDHVAALESTGFWGRAAAGCLPISRESKRLLFAQRGPKVQEPGTWGLWGGALDEDETPVQAIKRELHEEAGYNGRAEFVLLDVFSHASGFKYYSYIALVDTEFRAQLNWETSKARWVEFGRWPRPLHPGLKLTLSKPSITNFLKQYL